MKFIQKLLIAAFLLVGVSATAKAEVAGIDLWSLNTTTVTFSSANFVCAAVSTVLRGVIVSSNSLSTNSLIFRSTASVTARAEAAGGADYLTTDTIFTLRLTTQTTKNGNPYTVDGETKFWSFDPPIPFPNGLTVKANVNTINEVVVITEDRTSRKW